MARLLVVKQRLVGRKMSKDIMEQSALTLVLDLSLYTRVLRMMFTHIHCLSSGSLLELSGSSDNNKAQYDLLEIGLNRGSPKVLKNHRFGVIRHNLSRTSRHGMKISRRRFCCLQCGLL